MQRDLTQALQEVDRLAQALSGLPSTLGRADIQKTEGDHQPDSRTKAALVSMLEEAWDVHESHAALGSARIPDDVLQALLRNQYFQSASRVAVKIFDHPWEDMHPPRKMTILAEWIRDSAPGNPVDAELDFADYVLSTLLLRDEVLLIEDVNQDERLNEKVRRFIKRFETRSLALCPLIASNLWFGMLIIHFRETLDPHNLPGIQNLVSQAAAAIYTMLLLKAETRARKQAEEANELRLKLLATISHELRTPLSSIKGFATTLLADDVEWDQESQRDFIETINQEADKLTELVEQLLNYSRLESGMLKVKSEKASLDQIINTAEAQLEILTADHELKVAVPKDLPPVNADPRRIAQVLTNLVNNAGKYAPPQTLIAISAEAADQHIRVDVSDQGPGIKPEDQLHIFEAFFRSEALKTGRKGAGLGLAICRGIIDIHGGRIWIKESSESGTTISFTLPVYEE